MSDQAAKRIAVARAICTACHENPDHKGDAGGNQYRWQDYLDVADAAIAAMSGDDVPGLTGTSSKKALALSAHRDYGMGIEKLEGETSERSNAV